MTAIGVGQAPSRPGDLAANLHTAQELVAEAATLGVDLLVLPELFLSGYDPAGIMANPASHVVRPEDEVVAQLRSSCAENDVAAVVGAAVEIDGSCMNAAILIGADGTLVDTYGKVHLWGDEREAFRPGPHLCVAELAGCRVGVAICFDAGFPEHTRALTLAGAEIIVAPVAFAEGDQRQRYERYYPMRALENTVYVAVANAVGPQGGDEMFGESMLLGPRGQELARVVTSRGIAVADFDRAELASARTDLPYLTDLASGSTNAPVAHHEGEA